MLRLCCTVQQQQTTKLTCCAHGGTSATVSGWLSGCQVPCLPAALQAHRGLSVRSSGMPISLRQPVAALCRVLSLHHIAAVLCSILTLCHPPCCAVQGRQPAKLQRPAPPQSRVCSHRSGRSGTHAWPFLNTRQPPRSGSAPRSQGLPPWPLQLQRISFRPAAPSLLLAAGVGPGGASRSCLTAAPSRWQAAAPGRGLDQQG